MNTFLTLSTADERNNKTEIRIRFVADQLSDSSDTCLEAKAMHCFNVAVFE
jgi:hypothetical protein